MSRNRFRRAHTSLPGYDDQGYESFGHPAAKAQPAVDAYGIDSEFGEGVRKGPYRSGPAPASYGWTPDHPAADEDLIDDYEESSEMYEHNLRKAMERKASKCIEIAENRLGRTASQEEIEELALRFMDLPSRQINAKLNRIASDFIAGDELQEATGYEGDDEGVANVMADDETAEDMAEEIATLKAANARLASQLRRIAEDVVQKETGYEGDDESEEVLDEEEPEGKTKKLASHHMAEEEIAEDMAILAELMHQATEDGDMERMSEIMAEMQIVAGGRRGKGTKPYGTTVSKFDYQDPSTRAKHRALGRAGEAVSNSWANQPDLKQEYNELHYQEHKNNAKWWGVGKGEEKKAEDIYAEDILSDAEFAEIMAEMDLIARGSRGKGRKEYGNSVKQWQDYMSKEDKKKVWDWNRGGQQGNRPKTEIVPGLLSDDPAAKSNYNHEYYRENPEMWNSKPDKDGYPRNAQGSDAKRRPYKWNKNQKDETLPQGKRRVMRGPIKKAFDETSMRLAAEEQAMLNEMLAEMEAEMAMADQNDPHAFDMMAEEDIADEGMADEGMADEGMADEGMADDIMGLDMEGDEEAGLDPKLARIFQAAEELSEEESAEDETAEDETTEEEPAPAKKSASFRPQTQARQASVKTLGNISREASSASDELSKLWESAPDVSKYFG